MDIDMRNLLIDFADAFNVRCFFVKDNFNNISGFDLNFREEFYTENPYDNITKLFSKLKQDTLMWLEDQFLIRYIVFLVPESIKIMEEKYCVIGPYASRSWDEVLAELALNKNISELQIEFLNEFYESLPKIVDEEPTIMALSKIINYIDKHKNPMKLMHKRVVWEELENEYIGNRVGIDYINALEVANRYRLEAEMLDMVRKGDFDKVMKIQANFSNVKVHTRYRGNIHNAKTGLNTLNTLCRMTLQKTAVHPVHIDNLSSRMANLIESSTSQIQLNSLNEVILKKYCDLVLESSLSNYSSYIREVLSFIEFNLSEPLSLSYISEALNLDAKVLTSKFSEEVGTRLTKYINEKRIEESLLYLSGSDLSIQDIAGKVGFLDDNYFRRVFKKVMEITPNQYRKENKNEYLY